MSTWHQCHDACSFPDSLPEPVKCVIVPADRLIFTVEWKLTSALIDVEKNTIRMFSNERHPHFYVTGEYDLEEGGCVLQNVLKADEEDL